MDFKKVTDYLKLTTPVKDIDTLNPAEPQKKEGKEEFFIKQEPLEELLSWKIETPPFKIPKKIIRSGFVFVLLFCIFLVLAADWINLVAILGILFLVNLLLRDKNPKKLSYILYTNGIDYCGDFYTWEQLSSYFFFEGTTNQIVILSKDTFPGRIYLYFKEDERDKIDSILNKYLPKNLVHQKDLYEFIIFKVKPYLNLTDEK